MAEGKPQEPIPPQDIYQAICGAASQDPSLVQSCTKLLQEFEDHPGTWEQLHAIVAEKTNVALDVRRMAIIQFKNGALNVWKNRRLYNKEMQQNIRQRSMGMLYEEDNIIADCNALIIARIARNDFPSQWPTLISDLAGVIQTQLDAFISNPTSPEPSGIILLKRSLGALNQTVKELSKMKMLTGVKTMAQTAEALYSPLISHYDRLSSLLLSSFNAPSLLDPDLQAACEEVVVLSHMVFKPCVKIMLWLWQKSSQPEFKAAYQTICDFSQSCFPLVQKLFDLRIETVSTLRQVRISGSDASLSQSTIPPMTSKSIDYLTRHIRLFGKMFRRMQQLSGKKFVELPGANEFVLYYWSEVVKAAGGPQDFIGDSFDSVYPIRLLVQGMVLFRDALNTWSGRGDPQKMMDVLSQQSAEEAVNLLMTRFIPLTPVDLEKWSTDPEEWVNEEEKDEQAWEYEIRPCGERVLLTLCTHYSIYVVPVLLGMLQQVLSTPANDLSRIIQKEAVYCAIGRCAVRLYSVVDFDDWLQKHLVFEAQDTNPDFRIVKRRIAWIVGKWHVNQIQGSSKTQVWEVLRHLIKDRGASSDPVVRLSAAEALRECVDIVEFDADVFTPYLGDFVTQLVQLLSEADTLESKRRLVKTLNLLVERSEGRIVPYIEIIIRTLSNLWQETDDSGEGCLFKAHLVVMMTRVVEAMREHSINISDVVITLLQECFSPKAKAYLDVDGLDLWLAAIRNAVTIQSTRNGSMGYIDMFPHAVFLLSDNLDVLGTTTTIVTSYVLLDVNTVLAMYGRQLFDALVSALTKAVKTNVKEILTLINLIIQLGQPSLWGEPMHASGLFALLAKGLIDDKDPALILTEHVYIFSRITLVDSHLFNQLVASSALALNLIETQVFEGILDQWWSKFDNMTYPQHRKLTAMGIAAWVSTGRPEVLGRLYSEVFNLWLDVFGELKEAFAPDAHESSPLTVFWRNSLEEPEDLVDTDIKKTVEGDRRPAVFRQDPVNNVKLTVFIQEKLQQAEIACGGPEAFKANYLDKADPTVLQQLTTELITGR